MAVATSEHNANLSTFMNNRNTPSVGLLLNGSLAVLLRPDYLDGRRLRLWALVGVVLAVAFCVNVRRERFASRLLGDGLPASAHLTAIASGTWVGGLAWIDLEATRVDEFAYLVALIVFGTTFRLLLYGTLGWLRPMWGLSLLVSAASGFAAAGQWGLVLAFVGVGIWAARISAESTRTYEELLRLRLDSVEREQAAAWDANHDPLTGLLNRRGLERRAAEASNLDYCLFIDLDHFKLINDHYGHEVGDEVLRAVARRLDSVAERHGLAARIGGDEFVVLLDEYADGDAIGRSLLSSVRRPIELTAHDPITISASVGGVQALGAGTLPNLLRRSDKALYEAKGAGRDQFVAATEVADGEPLDRTADSPSAEPPGLGY